MQGPNFFVEWRRLFHVAVGVSPWPPEESTPSRARLQRLSTSGGSANDGKFISMNVETKLLSPVQSLPSLRIIPTDWAAPLDLPAAFGRAPQRLEVDLGCGKGRFLLARAAAHPETSFLGLDRQTRRLAKVERKAQRAHLANIRLLYAE